MCNINNLKEKIYIFYNYLHLQATLRKLIKIKPISSEAS